MRELPKICNRIKQDLYNLYKYVQDTVTDQIDNVNTSVHDIEFLGWEVPSGSPIQNSFDGTTFTQRVGRLDLGALTYEKFTSNKGVTGFRSVIPNTNNPSDTEVAKFYVTANYTRVSASVGYNSNVDKTIAIDRSNKVNIYDNSYTDATEFKSAMQGVYLYYELETPIIYNIGDESTIKYEDINVGTITIGSGGYIDIPSQFIPKNKTIKIAKVQNFDTMSTPSAITVSAGGTFVIGTPNNTITNLRIRYYY